MSKPSIETVEALALSVLPYGGRQRRDIDGNVLRQFEAELTGRCETPVSVTHWSMQSHRVQEMRKASIFPGDLAANISPGRKAGMTGDLQVRCRKCAGCKAEHAALWRQRAMHEIHDAALHGCRTWFGTLTFSEIHLAALFMQGKATAALRGIPLAEAVERHAYAEVKLYHKRLRKRLGAKRGYRFVAVAEYGEENGRLHYHILVHELGAPITYRDLLAAWRSGFMHAKLVQCDATSSMAGIAGYVSKYIAKSLTSAVRASTQYGKVSQT